MVKWDKEFRDKISDWGIGTITMVAFDFFLGLRVNMKIIHKNIDSSIIKDVALRSLELTHEDKRRRVSMIDVIAAVKELAPDLLKLEFLHVNNLKNALIENALDKNVDSNLNTSTILEYIKISYELEPFKETFLKILDIFDLDNKNLVLEAIFGDFKDNIKEGLPNLNLNEILKILPAELRDSLNFNEEDLKRFIKFYLTLLDKRGDDSQRNYFRDWLIDFSNGSEKIKEFLLEFNFKRTFLEGITIKREIPLSEELNRFLYGRQELNEIKKKSIAKEINAKTNSVNDLVKQFKKDQHDIFINNLKTNKLDVLFQNNEILAVCSDGVLNLRDKNLIEIPDTIGNLTSLKKIDLFYNNLEYIPESIGNLDLLEVLDLDCNRLQSLPDSIGTLRSLIKLNLNQNKLHLLPDSIAKLRNLKILTINENYLTSLPENIGSLSSLEKLSINENRLKMIPESIGKLESLRKLSLIDNKLTEIPESIKDLTALEHVYLEYNAFNDDNLKLKDLVEELQDKNIKIEIKYLNFNIEELVEFTINKINEFAQNHQNETFYAFAVEGRFLSLNSISEFEKTLKKYKYEKEKDIKRLKFNPGDWRYQGFANLKNSGGWSEKLYEVFYEMPWDDDNRLKMAYPIAINELLKNLKEKDAFRSLNIVDDFFIGRIDYD